MTAISHPPIVLPDRPPSRTSATTPVAFETIRALLHGLDRRQRQAVTHAEGPLLVIAGPGTGKTEVITRRVAWLIASRRARPAEILALTFTERAADEMQARVDLLVPYGQATTAIHTFHAFGDWLLREHGHAIGRPMDPRVIGRAEAMVLLADHLFELGLERYRPLADPTRFLGALVDVIARAKEEGLTPDDLEAYAAELDAGARAGFAGLGGDDASDALAALLDEAVSQAELARAFRAYQRLLAERSLIDHGDQVAEAVRLLEERPAVRHALRQRFRYLVVDEAQDANPQQLRLVRLLAGERGNVTFVGDDDQAIYTFRGAVGQELASLPGTYPGLKHVVLRRNYRSRRPILEAARRLIRHNDPHRLEVQRGVDKSLTAVRRARRPAPVRQRAFLTAADEADAVAADITDLLARGRRPGSIAVLVRSNLDAGPVLASLDGRGIPRRFSGASGLFSYPEVRHDAQPAASHRLAGSLGGPLRRPHRGALCPGWRGPLGHLRARRSAAPEPLVRRHGAARAARPAAPLSVDPGRAGAVCGRSCEPPSWQPMSAPLRQSSTSTCGRADGCASSWRERRWVMTTRFGAWPASSRSSRPSPSILGRSPAAHRRPSAAVAHRCGAGSRRQ